MGLRLAAALLALIGVACTTQVVVDDSQASCADVVCSHHGTCAVSGGAPVCVCNPGWSAHGLACVPTIVPDPCDGIDCDGHGSCATLDGLARCLCDDGWRSEGTRCSEIVVPDPCEGIDCDGHGRCASLAGAAQCVCDGGYRAETPTSCLPVFTCTLAPASLDFGRQFLNVGAKKSLTLTNDSMEPVEVTVGVVAGAAAITLDASAAGKHTLAPTESLILEVTFAPTVPGMHAATLAVSGPGGCQFPGVLLVGEGRESCAFAIGPARLDFGTVEPGHRRTLYTSIRNTSPNPLSACEVSAALSTLGDRSFLLPSGPVTTTLHGGEALELAVHFSPTQAGAFTGALSFTSPDSVAAPGDVALSGNAGSTCLVVAPDDFQFGPSSTSCGGYPRTLEVYNACSADQQIDSVTLQAGDAAKFTLVPPAVPVALAHGASISIGLTYHPHDLGTDRAVVAIKGAQTILATLSGEGAASSQRTETLHQPVTQTDVLFIVDNSGSMTDKQNALAAAFDSLIAQAHAWSIDYRFAVTTTSVDRAHGGQVDNPGDENGVFVPVDGSRPRIVTDPMPNAKQLFAQNVKVGTAGNATELLLRPMYLALSYPNALSSNAGFLRSDAALAVVVLSDAADTDAMPLGFYPGFLRNLKGPGRQNMVFVDALVPTLPTPPPGTCTYDGSAHDNTRAKDLADQTGGVTMEICSTVWNSALAQDVFGPRVRYYLSVPPDRSVLPESIAVEVDGVPCLEGVRWTWLPAQNAIEFQQVAAPDPLSTVTATYQAACP